MAAYRHPELVQALNGLTPAQQLRELILLAFDTCALKAAPGQSVDQTAAELESALTHFESSTPTQARTLLRGARQAGRYLSELSKQSDALVHKLPLRDGVQHWQLTRKWGSG